VSADNRLRCLAFRNKWRTNVKIIDPLFMFFVMIRLMEFVRCVNRSQTVLLRSVLPYLLSLLI